MTPAAEGQTDSQPTLLMVPSQPPVGPATEGSDPWQLQFYDVVARDIIERAKQFSHCDVASINAFPLRADFKLKAVEYINKVGGPTITPASLDWLPATHRSDFQLWEDLGNWRLALKKRARGLLGARGVFLKNGVDDEGHTNNLVHPALSGLIVDFFYTGATSIGKLFPEVFESEVPRVAVAMAATVLKVALDEIVGGQGEVNFRVGVYSPVYLEILGLVAKCDTSDIHAAKTKALWVQWARTGSNGTKDQPSIAATASSFDVDLD
ncbi:hypothetical protein PAXINDRAFT_157171 [Paxillus involutus ATCC 200175]|uniref:DUF6532 domain-containing protein n=1 Tax=Paxillus involutus ATCC 200175 TaxID=664439 RepID=A0A0C9TVM2_PAXIN|nr:hypothetical protein PAXINDRAFT_157171 [Paxillus involutus ATCC 200175]